AVSSSRGHRGKIARVCEPPCHPGCERPAFPRWTRRWTMSIPDSLEDELIQTVQAVVASGAISMSRHGNVSLRVPGRDELLFTAGGTLAGFGRDGIVRLGLDGALLEGELPPLAAAVVGMHTAISRQPPDPGCV